MSEQTKSAIWSWGAASACIAALGLLLTIAKSTWTVASGWGSTMEKIRSIDVNMQEHIKQTQEFRSEFERRLREIERKVGIAIRTNNQ